MFLSFEKRRRRGTGGLCTCNHNEGLAHQNCHLSNGTALAVLPNDRMYGSTSALYQRPDMTNPNLTTNVKNKSSCQSIRSVSNIPKLLTPFQCRPANNNRSSFHSHTHPESSLGLTNSASNSTPVLSGGLRRQTSLGHLEGQTSTTANSKPQNSRHSEGAFGSFHQRIRAILLPTKDSSKPKVNAINGNDAMAANQGMDSMQRTSDSQNSVNMYTPVAAAGPSVVSPTADAFCGFDDENDSYHMRDVCNKWFAQKRCPMNQSLTSQMASAVTKSSVLTDSPKLSHNMTANALDKVMVKDIIRHNSYTNSTNANNPLMNGSVLSESNSSAYDSVERQRIQSDCDLMTAVVSDEHVVVVSGLECDTNRNTSLTVRSEVSPNEVISETHAIPSGANHALQTNCPLNAINVNSNSDTQGSDTVSQEHNYKSSSDSGRGTIRDGENGLKNDSPDGTSPLDLTSLDSDQSTSGVTTREWINQNLSQESAVKTVSSNETIEEMQRELQRILEDNHSVQSSEVEVDDLSRTFKTQLSVVNESDSWTSNTPPLTPNPPINGTTAKFCEPKPDMKCTASNPKNISSKTTNSRQKCKTIEKQVIGSNKQNILNDKNKYSVQRSTKTGPVITNMSSGGKCRSNMSNDRSYYSIPNRAKHRSTHPNDKSKDRFMNLVDCDILSTTTARDSTYADDLSSEYTANTSVCGEGNVYSIRKQLQGLENMYSEILGMMGSRVRPDVGQRTRRKVCRSASSIVSGRSSVTSRGTRDMYYRRNKYEYKRHKSEDSHSSRRIKRLESHVITLARSVAQLSTDMRYNHSLSQEVENLRQEMDLIREQMVAIKQSLSTNVYGISSKAHHHSNGHISANGRRVITTNHHIINPNKVEKLKKFFGDEPPLLRQFLKKLGYEKYARNFESEKIGITELPYLSEERMQKLGIPLGPRMRIMQESHTQYKSNPNNDHYSVYAIV